ncbi:TPA: hypothetical protein KEY68_001881 [Providencia rettgeri]|nr:hypothetical protein [Providencia rettgeri]
MHNSLYSDSSLYEHIRAFYMDAFPHAREYKSIYFLNFLLRRERCKGALQEIDGKIVFTENGHHWINTNFNDKKFLAEIAEDSNAFNLWLIEEGYVRNGIATKLLVNSPHLYQGQQFDIKGKIDKENKIELTVKR